MKGKNCSIVVSVVLCVLLVFSSTVSVFAWTIQPTNPIIIKPASEDISGEFTDAKFKQVVWEWLGNTGAPGKFTEMDLINNMAAQNYVLTLDNKGIKSIAGIEYFKGLKYLYGYGNQLTSLPALPDTITVIEFNNNKLKTLPTNLPPKLKGLYVDNNELTSLPKLPTTLIFLSCSNNQLKELPSLTANLSSLRCSYNKLTELPQLPSSLNYIYCSYNFITELPALPSMVEGLEINNNFLNIFADPLLTIIDKLSFPIKGVPQYRMAYKGTDIYLDINGTKQFASSEIKKQMSSDNTVWGDVENIDFSMLTFSSTDNSIAKVDSSGLITGKGQGTVSILVQVHRGTTDFTRIKIPVTVSGQTASGQTTAAEGTGGANTGTADYMSASSWAVPELETAEQLNLFTDKVKNDLKQNITREEFSGIAVKLYERLSGKEALPCVVNPFDDTGDSDILKAYELGIVYGVSADQFAPNNRISRQEICVMITRALKAAKPDLDYNITDYDRFDDENKIAGWAINEVRYASKNSIMKGVGGNTIDPLGNTSREQGVIMIKRTYEGFRNQ
jgi:hypothetical protein